MKIIEAAAPDYLWTHYESAGNPVYTTDSTAPTKVARIGNSITFDILVNIPAIVATEAADFQVGYLNDFFNTSSTERYVRILRWLKPANPGDGNYLHIHRARIIGGGSSPIASGGPYRGVGGADMTVSLYVNAGTPKTATDVLSTDSVALKTSASAPYIEDLTLDKDFSILGQASRANEISLIVLNNAVGSTVAGSFRVLLEGSIFT